MSEATVPELSPDELHDVTCVATAGNEFEAIALIDALEDVGIPAMKQGGIVHLGQLAPSDILVPRKMLEQARLEIARFRGDATERGVAEAFKAENVQEQFEDPRADSLTAQMLSLSTEPKELRLVALEGRVAEWLADGMSAPAMARNLAAAGLERLEAEKLVANVKVNKSQLVRDSLNRNFYIGVGICLMGLIFLAAQFPRFASVGIGLLILGAFLSSIAWSRMPDYDDGDDSAG